MLVILPTKYLEHQMVNNCTKCTLYSADRQQADIMTRLGLKSFADKGQITIMRGLPVMIVHRICMNIVRY